jgi:hypothetical protein
VGENSAALPDTDANGKRDLAMSKRHPRRGSTVRVSIAAVCAMHSPEALFDVVKHTRALLRRQGNPRGAIRLRRGALTAFAGLGHQ